MHNISEKFQEHLGSISNPRDLHIIVSMNIIQPEQTSNKMWEKEMIPQKILNYYNC